jgi:hypothetical protein
MPFTLFRFWRQYAVFGGFHASLPPFYITPD